MRTKIAALLLKEESEYGTDPTPTIGANGIRVISDLVITPVGELQPRNVYGVTLSQEAPLMGQQWMEISFVAEMTGSGSAGTAPRIGDALEACGMVEAVETSTAVRYNTASASLKSCTIWAYLGSGTGLLMKFNGCKGTFRIMAVAGETLKIEFRFLGKYASPTDASLVSQPTYDTPAPSRCKGTTFTFDSYEAVVQQLEIDISNVIAKRDSITDSTGVAGFEITNRDPRGSMNPEAVIADTYDFFDTWETSGEKAISCIVGATAGNIVTLSGTQVVLETIGFGDREGTRTFEIPFKLARATVDDEFGIKFT